MRRQLDNVLCTLRDGLLLWVVVISEIGYQLRKKRRRA